VARFTVVPASNTGFKLATGTYGTGAAYLVGYGKQFGLYPFGFKFIGDSPARRFGRKAQLLLLRVVVYFNNNAVNIVTEVVPFGIPWLINSSTPLISLTKRLLWLSIWKPQLFTASRLSQWVLNRVFRYIGNTGNNPAGGGPLRQNPAVS
jgi:hypothetical protein